MMKKFDLDVQRKMCIKYKAKLVECRPDMMVGISKNFNAGNDPIYGTRNKIEGQGTGWFIWSGQEMSKEDDFFQPLHAHHLKEIAPQVLPYLGLPPGWGFIIDSKGYVDVWFDEKRLND